MADYYKILGLSPEADEREIRAAYRRMAKKYHPDAGEGSSAEKFRAVQDAYDLLSDSEKRREYDRSREAESLLHSAAYTPRYSARPLHIDLRAVMNSRARVYAEPMGSRLSRRDMRDLDDPWREMLEFLFWEF